MSKTYDIFLSYAHADKAAVAPLRDALRTAGLKVWFDESAVENFSAVSQTVGDGLSVSKALLAFYSRTYPTRRPCQWELTAAYVAAQRLGEPSRRVLVVNPEPGSRDHIQPTSLRDTLLPTFPDPGDADALRALAESVRARVAALQGTLDDVGPMVAPRWHPIAAIQSPRFVGRVPDLWATHSTLHAAEYPLTTGQHTRVVFVSGFGGIGKTLLAEEYALRFGAAYPGGVFWLRAFGGDSERADVDAEVREAERDRQIREIGRSLGLTVEDLPLTQVRGMIAGELQRAGQAALWVVDDLPEGVSSDDVRGWLAPHPFAATLVTTRSREYGALGTILQPGVLPPDEGYDLLTFQRKPTSAAEEEAAREIVTELGSHALAVEIAGAALHHSRDRTFAEFLNDLRDTSQDELALASELAPVLPTVRKEGIATMLRRSIVNLSSDAGAVLTIASMLPPSPIPDSVLIETLVQSRSRNSQREAKHKARKAVAETDRHSLTERVGENAHTVHPLILRAVRFAQESENLATEELRQTIITVVAGEVERLNALPPAHADATLLPHAHALVQTLHARSDAFLADELGNYCYRRGQYGLANEIWARLVEYARNVWGEEAPRTLDCMSNLASAVSALGDIEAGLALNKQVLDARRRILGEEHPDTLSSMTNLASDLAEIGDYAGARALEEQVLDIRRRVLGPEHPATLRIMNNLANRLAETGHEARAKELTTEAYKIARRVLGAEHPETLMMMNNLANRLSDDGDPAGAKELYEEVFAIARRVLGEEHPDTLAIMSNVAFGFAETGNRLGARDLYHKVWDIRRRILGEMHPDTARSAQRLATIQAQIDDLDQP